MSEKSTIFAEKNINLAEVMSFMKKCKANKTDIHSFEIVQNGEVKLRVAPKPYSFDYKQQLYSLSKSFTSTAIGLLADDGLLSIEDRIIDIFSDKCPEQPGKNLSEMRVRHVLSMNTGHSRCVLDDIRHSEDPVSMFLRIEPEYAPGTHFVYNNAATYMLSEIVGKYTGMSMFDFLSIRLFEPLGIEGAYWDAFPDGNSQGAVGLHASTDDLIKLGLLYLNKGVYNGKRIFSEKWTEEASRAWSDNSQNGTPDWTAGYGFQFWRNDRMGFRGDGAFGQLCMIFPSINTVFAMQVFSEDMQSEINYLYELTEKLYGESSVTAEEFAEFVDRYNTPVAYSDAECGIFGKLYRCRKNGYGITLIRFTESDDSIDLNFSNGTSWQTMRFGKGCFAENNVVLKKFKITLEGLAGHKDRERLHFAAYCTYRDSALQLYINYLDNPHTDEYVCSFDNGSLLIKRAKKLDFCYDEDITGELI